MQRPLRRVLLVALAGGLVTAIIVLAVSWRPGGGPAASVRATPSPAAAPASTGAIPSASLTPRPLATMSTSPTSGPSAAPTAPAGPAPSPVSVVAAGDIATCATNADSQTARLVARIRGTVLALGDNAYNRGTAREYAACYGPTWGRERARTRPVPGNHEYGTARAAGYTGYFGRSARPDGETWYAFDLGAWRVIALDSNCGQVGGCGTDSPQGRWLSAELAANPRTCTLAFFHHPRFSSGFHGDQGAVAPFWNLLYAGGADLIVNGHDHDYERFAPQDPNGLADPKSGIREIVVGTGGAALRPFAGRQPNSEVRNATTHGVLRLTLSAGGYAWSFVPVAGATFSDAGQGVCH